MAEFEKNKNVSEDEVKLCEILIRGDGAKLTQGVITKDDYYVIKEYEEWEEIEKEEAWTRAMDNTIPGFESEKYFTDNLRAFFNGPYLDSEANIEVWLDGNMLINTKIKDLPFANDHINISLNGNKCCDENDIGDILTSHIDHKDDMVLDCRFKLKGPFDWDKLSLLVGHTDEVSTGFDYGDFVLGIKYDEETYEPFLDEYPYEDAETSYIEVNYDLIYSNGIN